MAWDKMIEDRDREAENFRSDPDHDPTCKNGSPIRSRSSKKDRDPNLSIMDRKILMPYA